MKILTVIGARPQFIKAAAVSAAIQQTDGIQEVIVHTGQHYDPNMSDIFFKEMSIPKPKYMFDLGGLSHGKMTGRMIEKIEEACIKEKPDYLLVYGDTNSTLAGALAAKKLHINVAHVESGLRSFNMRMPEEVNRMLTDRISSLLFCPTDLAIENLKREGIQYNDVHWVVKTGDVMLDAFRLFQPYSTKIEGLPDQFALCTLHRAENTDDLAKLTNILSALNQISDEINVVIPLHPRTAKVIEKYNLKFAQGVKLIEPVSYFEMIGLLTSCSFVLTDSGGLQKEAFFAGKACITLREETEWVELVESGFNQVVGSDKSKILSAFKNIENVKVNPKLDLYGQGDSAYRIVKELMKMQKEFG
ncbi:MAG: UDP-N-acetylglucosamine 2-epimerase (non-hydrolyzing) [Flavobacteriaceae bacterium]|nr:UDP-N-acetylglucosamine 2-epimerase (non-hydrolyzing) [Flavobacteriaceae bacterium]